MLSPNLRHKWAQVVAHRTGKKAEGVPIRVCQGAGRKMDPTAPVGVGVRQPGVSSLSNWVGECIHPKELSVSGPGSLEQ